MKKWYLIIDVKKCLDCNNCFISCKDEHEDNDWPGYTLAQPRHDHRWINIHRHERGQYPLIDVAYRPTPCMHCQDAPCVKASGGAISCREDGIVLIDQEKAKGRKELVQSCPYGAIYWNEDSQVPQKCTMCAHLLDDGWSQPRCVQSCFTGALTVERLENEEIEARVTSEGLETLHPERGTRPNVFYKNLHLFNKAFIAGSAAVRNEDVVDCLKGAQVRLYQGIKVIQEVETDAFGDFKFDRLSKDSGEYLVQLEFDGRKSDEMRVNLGQSINVGTVFVG